MRTRKWPPLDQGTQVLTSRENPSLRDEWTAETRSKRQWGVGGYILKHHDSHGLCYEVNHPDGTVGTYDPSEFGVVAGMHLSLDSLCSHARSLVEMAKTLAEARERLNRGFWPRAIAEVSDLGEQGWLVLLRPDSDSSDAIRVICKRN